MLHDYILFYINLGKFQFKENEFSFSYWILDKLCAISICFELIKKKDIIF